MFKWGRMKLWGWKICRKAIELCTWLLHIPILKQSILSFNFLLFFPLKKNFFLLALAGRNLRRTWSTGDISKMEDIYKRWTKYLDSTRSRVNHPPPINCAFCGGEHFNDNCHLYPMKNSWWGQELHPYNQYKKKELLILRVCLRNSWHTMLALKPIKTQCKIRKFMLVRATPWKIISGSKSYNPTINM